MCLLSVAKNDLRNLHPMRFRDGRDVFGADDGAGGVGGPFGDGGLDFLRMRSARPRGSSAVRPHALKSSRVKLSRLPFMLIWCVEVHAPCGL